MVEVVPADCVSPLGDGPGGGVVVDEDALVGGLDVGVGGHDFENLSCGQWVPSPGFCGGCFIWRRRLPAGVG